MRLSVIVGLCLAVALGAWLAHPLLIGQESETSAAESVIGSDEPAQASTSVRPPVSVRTRISMAEEVARTVVSHGKTAPARSVTLRAEAEGRVVGLPIDRGAPVSLGETVIYLDPREKQQMLNQAQAALGQKQIEYDAAQQLGKRGFQAETAVAKALAELELARAMVQQEKIVLEHTKINAPFDGILQTRPVEMGDFLKVGDEAASILEIDPLIVTADLPESAGTAIAKGMAGKATLIDGTVVEGTLRYVSSEASTQTRTFRVELEVANPNGKLPAGISATLAIELATVTAHKLPSSLLSLDEEGQVGLKTVDDDNIVRFMPANIVKSAQNTVWLAGLPQAVNVITVGQGFVRENQLVDPRPEASDTAQSEQVAKSDAD